MRKESLTGPIIPFRRAEHESNSLGRAAPGKNRRNLGSAADQATEFGKSPRPLFSEASKREHTHSGILNEVAEGLSHAFDFEAQAAERLGDAVGIRADDARRPFASP